MATWVLAYRRFTDIGTTVPRALWPRLSSVSSKFSNWKRSVFTDAVTVNNTSVSSEVKDALVSNKPVVALETTIITHGMPYPQNLETAFLVDQTVRDNGGVPATIGIVKGKICIGMSHAELERLADPSVPKIKVSRGDIAMAISKGLDGGTTVSGTMVCAHAVGIPLFVTGGIGGVHRDGQNTLDISTDLTELGRTPVTVVSSGVKSILDIPRTLEYLETQGVTVATYGSSKEFPAFFTSHSGVEVEYNLQNPKECAELIATSRSLSLSSGMLIAVPVPQESAIDSVEQIIQQSLCEASDKGVSGKAVTPYVLKRLNQLSSGASLRSNIDLIVNNARVGTMISVELSKLERLEGRDQSSGTPSDVIRKRAATSVAKQPVVIGASVFDFTAKIHSKEILGGTNSGSLHTSFGGVGRNIAESLARLECDPFFISAVGNDQYGDQIIEDLRSTCRSVDGVRRLSEKSTSTYCAVIDGSGELYCGIGDMEANDNVTSEWVGRFKDTIQQSPLVCVDGNVPQETIDYVCSTCSEASVPVWFEPTCIRKSIKPILAGVQDKISYSSPNIAELKAMGEATAGESLTLRGVPTDQVYQVLTFAQPLLADIPNLFVTLGKDGLLYISREAGQAKLYATAPPGLLKMEIASVSGAGDSMVSGIIAGLLGKRSIEDAIKLGVKCAYHSVQSTRTVPRDLSTEMLLDGLEQWDSLEPKIFNL